MPPRGWNGEPPARRRDAPAEKPSALAGTARSAVLALAVRGIGTEQPPRVPCRFEREQLRAERARLGPASRALGPRTAAEVAALLSAHGGLV